MFLHLFNNAQQTAFLALARQFIEADSKLSDEEHNLIELMYAEMGLDFDTELPSLTIAILSVSRFLRSYGVWSVLTLGVLGVAAVLGAMAFVRTRQGRGMLCSIPVIGPLLRLTALAEPGSCLNAGVGNAGNQHEVTTVNGRISNGSPSTLELRP